jgi:hypothetical protein
VQKIYADIKALDAEVLVVSFTAPGKVAAFVEKYPQPFPVVSDPERKAYQAFALGKTRLAAFLRLDVAWYYLRLIFRGWMPTAPDKDADLWQLGGDFVLDRLGRLCYAHPSKDSTDRPSNAELLEVLGKAAN